MRQLHEAQVELIDAFVAESGTPDITPALLEKDIHITDALAAIKAIVHEHVNFVFCGGTCLSKAHHIIQRMSEDVDLKVALAAGHGLSKSALRNHLGQLREKVCHELTNLGFEEVLDARMSRNENLYFASQWLYAPCYAAHESLRPFLQLEFTARQPRHGVVQKPIGYLLHDLVGREASWLMDCVTVEETLSEKVVSFLRRYAEDRAGRSRHVWDTALVRHIFDCHCILMANDGVLEKAAVHFKELVATDVIEFGKYLPSFVENPAAVLAEALASAECDTRCSQEYQQFLLPLIFGEMKPSFQVAYQSFRRCAETLLATL
jgi:predicted nucleotidyltransferase component of viral defense system